MDKEGTMRMERDSKRKATEPRCRMARNELVKQINRLSSRRLTFTPKTLNLCPDATILLHEKNFFLLVLTFLFFNYYRHYPRESSMRKNLPRTGFCVCARTSSLARPSPSTSTNKPILINVSLR